MINWLILGDCLEKMREIPDGGIDMILTDPPYGTTACAWDTCIPFEPMWEQLKRITKKNGAIVLFGSQPFTSALVMSNPKMFKYEWVWQKTMATNYLNFKKQPAKKHESVLVFGDKYPEYSPQMELGTPFIRKAGENEIRNPGAILSSVQKKTTIVNKGVRYPSSIQTFSNGNHGSVHPTQKPVALMEYLIKTYTSAGDTILDFCIGSGTTAVAAINTGRNCIGIEKDEHYYEVAKKRIQEAQEKLDSKLPL